MREHSRENSGTSGFMEQKKAGVTSGGDQNGERDKVKSEILAGAESCRTSQVLKRSLAFFPRRMEATDGL